MLNDVVASITGLDKLSMGLARRRLEELTKPPGSLGMLEEIVVRMAGIRGEPALERKVLVVMAADHGVVEEGVSAFPAEVTVQMVRNFLRGGAAINVLAKCSGAEVVVVDIGINEDVAAESLFFEKIRRGTGNIAVVPAMTREEAVQALEAGIRVLEREAEKGAGIVGTGEMGIGNTTASSAVLSAITGLDPEDTAGHGTGIDEQTFEKKCGVIRRAIAVNTPDPSDPLDVLAKVGGLEIGGLAGVIIGAAAKKIPVVTDGFVSGAAAMLAVQIAPLCRDYIFASHLSAEPGHRVMLDWLGMEPMLDLKMRLGEGTGAALAFQVIDAAVRLYREMSTFREASVSQKRE